MSAPLNQHRMYIYFTCPVDWVHFILLYLFSVLLVLFGVSSVVTTWMEMTCIKEMEPGKNRTPGDIFRDITKNFI